MKKAFLLLAILLFSGLFDIPCYSQTNTSSAPPDTITVFCRGNSSDTISVDKNFTEQRVVCVNWKNAAGKGARVPGEFRIGARTPVTIHVNHFNFLRYTVDFTVEEDTVESYRVLERLWSQALIFSGAGLAAANNEFDRAMTEWVFKMEDIDRALTSFLEQQMFEPVGLEDQIIAIVRDSIQPMRRHITDLQNLRERARSAFSQTQQPFERYAIFENRVAQHDRLLQRLRAFISSATLTAKGQSKLIQGRPSGTIVTVSISAKDELKTDKGPPVRVEYFVQSRLPVVFHSGLSYSGIRDVEFEKVRTVSGADLWEKTKDEAGSADLNAFLSYPIAGTNWSGAQDMLLVSLGTELAKPGTTLFAGLTLRPWSRWFVSGGVASSVVSDVDENLDKVLENLGGQLGTRELFREISRRRQFAPYFSISFSVID